MWQESYLTLVADPFRSASGPIADLGPSWAMGARPRRGAGSITSRFRMATSPRTPPPSTFGLLGNNAERETLSRI